MSQPAPLLEPVSAPRAQLDAHLADLESEAIYILRELTAECARPALLFSGGKDSAVLLHLARKAFWPGKLPFPLVHVDTGHNFPEVIAFRDEIVAQIGAQLIVGHVEDSIARGSVKLAHEGASRNGAQAVTLLETIAEHGFDALFGGARRDEEKARAKERIVSLRDAFGGWNPKAQRPELWRLFNTQRGAGENLRVFPISNWTELDIWQYIAHEGIRLPSLYFAHDRKVYRRGNLWTPVTPVSAPGDQDVVETRLVRFRTVGDMSCTCPVESSAATPQDIIIETIGTDVSERGATRLDDQAEDAAMERRKREGYF